MSGILLKKKKEKIKLFCQFGIIREINRISKHTKLTASEIARNALQDYLDKVEKEKVEAELEAGYKANYGYYIKSQKEWEHADKE